MSLPYKPLPLVDLLRGADLGLAARRTIHAAVPYPLSVSSQPYAVGVAEPVAVQRTDFVAIPTRDRDRAIDFYENILGLDRNQVSPTWVEFETGNLTLSIVEPEKVGMEFAPLPFGTIMLRVPDVAAARARLEEAGVEFLIETWDSGVCRGAVFRDPDGNSLGLHHRYAPYPDGRLP